MTNSTTPLSDFQLARNVERVLALGPRPIIELLIEIGEQRIQRYAEIDPEHLTALGGEAFPRPPLSEVTP